MKNQYKITRIAGFVVVVVSFLIAGIGFKIVRDDVNVMRDSGRENILWSAVQTEIELFRFINELEQFSEGQQRSSVRSVNARFDILWSRVAQFSHGSTGKRLEKYDKQDPAISHLFAKMKDVEPRIVGLEPGDSDAALKLVVEFSAFPKMLRALSRDVLHGEEQLRAGYRENLANSSSILTIISVVVVMASLIMLFVFARESSHYRILAEADEKLLAISDKASEAKSQFLAMMSHELRTPMNGVLGLLALVKQQGLGVRQEGLVIEAERSGRQMIGLLEDILDYSGLQGGNLTLVNKPYDPNEMAQAVSDMFGPVARREGTQFDVRVDPSCPKFLMGDGARIRQALHHFSLYLLETAGTHSIKLDITYQDDELHASISFEYGDNGGEWRPELIMGTGAQSSDHFASEALGPSVARGLVAEMGGSTFLDSQSGQLIVVHVCIPAKEFSPKSLLVSTECNSATLLAICKAALLPHNVLFLEPGDERSPHVVIIQAGSGAEKDMVRKWHSEQPQALLVALGQPVKESDFDDIISLPIDVLNVGRQKFLQLQPEATSPVENRGKR